MPAPPWRAALGVYAGALWYNSGIYLTGTAAEKLKYVPVYIVCGTQDGLLGNNQTAYSLLQGAGNTDIFFTTFTGGHESLLENWQNMYSWIKNYTNDRISSLEINKINLDYNLQNNFPNPFNPTTKIRFTIQTPPRSSPLLKGRIKEGFVTLKVYDILGNEIETLVNEAKPAGNYEVEFDGSNLSSGIYFYRLCAQDFVKSNKMMLLK